MSNILWGSSEILLLSNWLEKNNLVRTNLDKKIAIFAIKNKQNRFIHKKLAKIRTISMKGPMKLKYILFL